MNYNLEKEQSMGIAPKLPKTLDLIPDDMIVTPEDMAHYTCLSTRQMRRYCASGEIPSIQLGRKYGVQGADFKEFLKNRIPRSKSVQEAYYH